MNDVVMGKAVKVVDVMRLGERGGERIRNCGNYPPAQKYYFHLLLPRLLITFLHHRSRNDVRNQVSSVVLLVKVVVGVGI